MNIVIDLGNTRVKYAIYLDSVLQKLEYSLENLICDLEQNKEKTINILLSGSGNIDNIDTVQLKKYSSTLIKSSDIENFPLSFGYSNRRECGFDRIADCVGALTLKPRKPLLVIDAGTCITYNYIDATSCFLGGNISPGVDIRFKSLNDYTHKLSLVKAQTPFGGIANNTHDSILNGVLQGILFEIQAYLSHFRSENPDGEIIITGGSSKFFIDKLSDDIIFIEDLGFRGLNQLLILNS